MSNFRRNTRNKENILYKTLTRIFSGPIMRQRRQFYTRERRQDMSKYQSWFKSASGQPFKIQSRDIFSNMTAKLISEQQRAERYSDFDFMVYDPILAVCLDIYAEEITSCTIFEDVLKINCKNQEIKQILHELYYNILNVRSNLFYWVKTMCKYGDFFLYLDIDDELGVVNVVSLPLREVERMEGKDPTNPQYVQFQWNSGGMTFENWQVAHFRILGDEKFAPYGSSIFEPARRIWRMYELIQEAMLSYRITRSAERRVFYIDVGNIEADKVEEYVLQAKSELKKNMILDEDSGRVDLRYNPLPVSSETYVPLLDGRILKIKDVCKEFENGNDLWVHSINDETFESVPGKVVWCGKNYTTDKLIRVWLDNQTYVETAPEHPFILKNGKVLRADELEVGQSLMPFYTKQSTKKDSPNVTNYPMVYDNNSETYKFVHRVVANDVHKDYKKQLTEEIKGTQNSYLVVHHVNFSKQNNAPENLLWMGEYDHICYHAQTGKENLIKYNKTKIHSLRTIERNKRLGLGKKLAESYNGSDLHKEHNEIRRKVQNSIWGDLEKKKERVELINKAYWKIPNECIEISKEIYQENPNINYHIFIEKFLQNEKIKKLILENNQGNKKFAYEKISVSTILPKIREMGYEGFSDLKNQSIKEYKNHKVLKIEIIERCEDVYCMTIEGANGEQDRHNFAVLSTNPETNQSDKYGIYIKNSIEDDFFIPVRGDSQTRIEPLPGGQYTGDIDDVKYMQNRMLASIKIPSSYVLSGDEGSGDEKTNLAQKDVRFANTVMRIQRNVIEELEFVGKVHLVALGFKGDDISNFTLSLHNPSKIATLQELEEWRTKFDVASAATEGFFSKRHVATKFFGLSEEEFIRNQREIFNDKKFELQLEQLVQMGNIEAQEGSFGPVGGGGLTGSEEVGNLGSPNEEIPIEPTTPATEEPGDETLLAQPSEPAKRDDDEGSNYVKIKKNLFGPNSYTTPGSKGKMYTPQTHDRRTSSGPRNQQMKSLWSKESSKNTKRDRPNSAARELMGLGRGILEENLNPQNIETLEELEYLQIEQIENILVDEKK